MYRLWLVISSFSKWLWLLATIKSQETAYWWPRVCTKWLFHHSSFIRPSHISHRKPYYNTEQFIEKCISVWIKCRQTHPGIISKFGNHACHPSHTLHRKTYRAVYWELHFRLNKMATTTSGNHIKIRQPCMGNKSLNCVVIKPSCYRFQTFYFI